MGGALFYFFKGTPGFDGSSAEGRSDARPGRQRCGIDFAAAMAVHTEALCPRSFSDLKAALRGDEFLVPCPGGCLVRGLLEGNA